MASKHDGKRARENMWVTHQNLARAKGGKPGYVFKGRSSAVVTKKVAAAKEPEGVAASDEPATTDAEAQGPTGST